MADPPDEGFLPPEPPGPEPELGQRPAPAPPPEPQPQAPAWQPPLTAAAARGPAAGQQPPAAAVRPRPDAGQPPGWQPPPPGWAAAAARAGLAAAAMGLPAASPTTARRSPASCWRWSRSGSGCFSAGLSSLLSLGLAIGGLIVSRHGKRNVAAGKTRKHKGLAQAGFVCSIVMIVLAALSTIAWASSVVLLATDEDFRNDFEDDDDGGLRLRRHLHDSARSARSPCRLAARLLS